MTLGTVKPESANLSMIDVTLSILLGRGTVFSGAGATSEGGP